MAIDSVNALYAHFPALITEMPPKFTSHKFILRLAQRHQGIYVSALSDYLEGGEPFREVHRQLSAHLHNFKDLVVHDGVAKSEDIFGHPNTCAQWRKL